jgi:hypothetical protein
MSIDTRKTIIVSIICIVIAAGIFAIAFSMFGCVSNPVVRRATGEFTGTVCGIGMEIDGDRVKTYAITHMSGDVIVPIELDAKNCYLVARGAYRTSGDGTIRFKGEIVYYKDGTVKYNVYEITKIPF